ncbi:hypothetical protein ACLX1H_007476 [Fusarium chlamydosporum]
MATPQVSEHPLFTGLRDLIEFFPVSRNEEDFIYCRSVTNHKTRCRHQLQEERKKKAMQLWSDIEEQKQCSDVATFYPMVERFLEASYLGRHLSTVQKAFEEWKGKHSAYANLTDTSFKTSPAGTQDLNRSLKDDSDDASQPGTPDPEIFDSSDLSNTSPFPTPLTEPDSVRTPIKGPTSILDRPMPCVPPGEVNQNPLFISDNDASNVNAITKDISTLSLGHACSNADSPSVYGKPATAESISSGDDVSFQGMPEEISIIRDGKTIIEQTTFDTSISQEEVPNVENISLGDEIAIHGIGVGQLSRKGTLHQVSPIFKDLSTPPTKSQWEYGVLYVLQHTQNEEIFKVGFTGQSAIQRQYQPNNCYGKNTKIIYESNTAFAGARKAEHLAHLFLRKQRLEVTDCAICGKGHVEWFKGTATVIVGTVTVMEDFIRLPAYELKAGQEENGEMMLSHEAERRIRNMFNISIEGLKGSVGAQKEPASIQMHARESVEVDGLTDTQISLPQITADVLVESTETDESFSQSTEPSKKPGVSPAKLMGRTAAGAKMIFKKGVENFKDKVQDIGGRLSRENTPDSDSFHESSKNSGNFENIFGDFLWALGGGSEDGSKEKRGPRGWNALVG